MAATALLAGCSNVPFAGKPIVQPCPTYFILEDAAALTKFKDGPGRDLTDIEYRAEMKTVELTCLSNIDRETKSGTMDVDVVPVVGAELGAAYSGETATLPYFVVVTNAEKKILYRDELRFEISFKGNRTRLIARPATTTIEIPITPEVNSKYYQIYSGFALSEDQAAFNRKAIQDRLR